MNANDLLDVSDIYNWIWRISHIRWHHANHGHMDSKIKETP